MGTLVVKTVNSVNTGTLVVAAENEKVFRVLDLVRQQQANRLQTLLSPIHIVPQEEVVGLGREAPILKQPQQVVVLPVNVA